MYYFCHAQLFEITHLANITVKVPLGNTHAETRKLWKRSAGLPSLEAILVDQFTSRPYALHAPAEMPTALSSLPRYADMHVPSCSRRAYHRERRRH